MLDEQSQRSFPTVWFALALLVVLLAARREQSSKTSISDAPSSGDATSLPAKVRNSRAVANAHRYADSARSAILASLEDFDLNSVTQEQLLGMGLPPSAAKQIIVRRAKWGCYKHPAQLKRIWSIAPAATALIVPYAHVGRAPRNAHYFMPCGALFPFNPNTASRNELQRLGFSAQAISMIELYRRKGGRFRKKEDFERLYCVDSVTYASLAPYIQLETPQRKQRTPYFTPADTLFPFDPNTATTDALLRLGFSERAVRMIIKYRNKGGVFRKKEDFKRLYCVDSGSYATLAPYIVVANPQRKQRTPYFTPADTLFPFDPNTATADALLRLGFSERAVRMIEKYRNKGGIFRKAEDFKRLYCVDSSTYSTLRPYIAIE